MKIKEKIFENIKKNQDEVFPCINEGNVELESIKKLRTIGLNITYSTRFLCTVISHSQKKHRSTIFVKFKDDVDKEYRNMSMLWNRHYSKNQQYLIPKPLFIDNVNNLLFLEFIKGESFLNGFYRDRNKKERIKILQNRIIDVANWLVNFQNIYQAKEEKTLTEEVINYKKNIQDINGLRDDEKRHIIIKMSSIIDSFPKYSNTFVHGHFLIRNLIFFKDRNKVCVVDFPKLTIGWPLYDFLTFVLGIDKLELYPFFTREMCENLRELFIAEYLDKSNMAYDRELVENLWVLYVITNLRKRYQNYKGIRIKGFENRFFVSKILKRLVNWSKN